MEVAEWRKLFIGGAVMLVQDAQIVKRLKKHICSLFKRRVFQFDSWYMNFYCIVQTVQYNIQNIQNSVFSEFYCAVFM